MSLKVVDGKLSLNKTRELTPKQTVKLSRFSNERQKQAYLHSLLGLIKGPVAVPKWSRGGDRLALKPNGSILSQLSRLRDVTAHHIPTDHDIGQWVGVEIECFLPIETINDHMGREDGAYATWRDGYNYLKSKIQAAGISRASIKQDGSLTDDDGDTVAVEVTIVFNTKHGYDQLEKLCKVLNNARCRVNKSCGLHVHLDVRRTDRRVVQKIGRRLGRALPILKWLVSESRHDNGFCHMGVSSLRGERYFAINLTAFNRHGTIEVRLHNGSTDFEKISNWIKMLKVVASTAVPRALVTFQDLLDLGISDALAGYAERRIKELHGEVVWSRLNPIQVETRIVA